MRIAILQGHPDAAGRHYGHALADAYAQAATEAGHEVRRIEIGALDFPLLRSRSDWQDGVVPDALREPQEMIAWSNHLVIVFPLWLGDMPALLKAFFEQVFRPGFAIDKSASAGLWKKLLKGRSAHVVVTMGMPAFFYRLYFRSHSVKSLERNILNFCGFSPVRTSIVGTVEGKQGPRERWLKTMRRDGAAGR